MKKQNKWRQKLYWLHFCFNKYGAFFASVAKRDVPHAFIYVPYKKYYIKINKPVCINCIQIEALRASLLLLYILQQLQKHLWIFLYDICTYGKELNEYLLKFKCLWYFATVSVVWFLFQWQLSCRPSLCFWLQPVVRTWAYEPYCCISFRLRLHCF